MNKKLLFSVTKKDLEITWYSGTGKGGQHRNKHQNCCRIKHPESNVLVTAGEQRNREANLKMAFKRLTEHVQFKLWLNDKIFEEINKEQSVVDIVKEMMQPINLEIEYTEEQE